MKSYTIQEAHYLIAFYSNSERIECEFELVQNRSVPTQKEELVGILCIDKSSNPPLVTDIDEVVKGLELTPTKEVLLGLSQAS